MKKFFIGIIFTMCLILSVVPKGAWAAETDNKVTNVNIILLKGTDETKDDMPVYEYLDDDDVSKEFDDIYNNSFMKKSMDLYEEALNYSTMSSDDRKNFYFAFRKNSGCHGSIGFFLKKDGQLIDMTKSPYIEMAPSALNRYDSFESVTQIFPHEMGHVIQAITSSNNDSIEQNSMDMHYSNIATEYSTAFSEGFGEHFEIISRMYEENDNLRNSINSDYDKTKENIKSIINKGKRDFTMPYRLDYYREVSLFWQQKFENIKREELGTSGDAKYKNIGHEFPDAEKTILFRNMGLAQDKSQMKNFEQSISTEIVIANFFERLIKNGDGDLISSYSKVFNVFNKYLNKDDKPQIIEFVKGYMTEYPEEKERVLDAVKESTGYDFTEDCPTEIWCMSQKPHSNMIFDQFNGIKFPIYTFNINACEKEDLLMIDGISKDDAEKIIAYRNKIHGFKNAQQFEEIEGISSKSLDALKDCTDINKINDVESKIYESAFENKYSNMFIASFKHLIIRTVVWFAIILIIYYFIFKKDLFDNINNKKNLIKLITKKFLKFFVYVIAGLISVFGSSCIVIGDRGTNPNPIILFLVIILICEGIILIRLRKEKLKFKDSLITTLMMILVIIYSLI